MATPTRSIKLSGPLTKAGVYKGIPFFKVISTRNTTMVLPGNYLTIDAVKDHLLPSVKNKVFPLEVNFVEPRKEDRERLQYVDEQRVLRTVS